VHFVDDVRHVRSQGRIFAAHKIGLLTHSILVPARRLQVIVSES
jgi:hypothetical protein